MIDYARKIKALLAKAASTDSPHEAENLQIRAEELMVKWGVDDAMLRDSEIRDEVVQAGFYIEDHPDLNYTWCGLATGIAEGLGSLRIMFGADDPSRVPLFVIGYERDCERWKMLWDLVFPQAQAALEVFWDDYLIRLPVGMRVTARDAAMKQQSFVLAYAQRIGDRLRTERQSVMDDTPGSDLVLVSRQEEVDRAVEEKFPDSVGADFQASDNYAVSAGWAGGGMANLSGREQLDG